ncbi:methyltransferase domain-containing protein [Nonomuraea sp. NPDC059007]|uniref:methyltransferase domain-containing protein n=1 Tax=Nonomuraea sp. NPDC059007 TaxID=3346692 RepID=UPI0036C03370
MHTLAVARSVHGIEHLVATEIRHAGLGIVREVRHREVWFEITGPGALELRMADDVLLVGAVVDGVGPRRDALRRLASAAATIDVHRLTAARPLEPGGRPLESDGGPFGVEVSASFLGRRAYNRYDIEDAVGPVLGRPYHARRAGRVPPAGAASWRVTVEGERAVIALRAGARPLHRRAYKVRSVPGTLHPPLAAAMAYLAEPKGLVVDPCCGAGTTLIEAAARAPEARTLGFDRCGEAIAAAAANGPRLAWARADAGRLPLPSGSVDRVLVNPPWQRQVRLAGSGHRLWAEVRRVLADGGRVVALVPEVPRGWAVPERVDISLFGRHPILAMMTPDKS